MKPKHYLIIAAVILALILSLQNCGPVRVALLFWDFSISLIILLYIILAIGVIIGFAINGIRNAKKGPNSEE